ncbi:hypothetical protein [Ignavibacterium sp.]|uniref:hypothetical protein n=1 Tax=Ignavibacterium sp. TaxID=2651167 RepID=UPI00307FBC6D
MKLAPIALFVYARPFETLQTLEALSKNFLASDSELFIFSDGAKGEKDFNQVNQVRDVIKNYPFPFKKIEIVERKKNFGLANSIISGVSEVLNDYDKVIVMEEDLVSSPNFLNFVNASLLRYVNEDKIFSVTGYTYDFEIPEDYKYDNYFLPRCASFGWGTWKNRWLKADWDLKDLNDFLSDKKSLKDFSEIGNDLLSMLLKQQLGKVNSWAIRWCYAHFKNNAFCSYPIKSKIIHIGEGGFATHVKSKTKFLETKLDDELKTEFRFSSNVFLDKSIAMQYQKMFKKKFTKRLRTLYYRMLFELKR